MHLANSRGVHGRLVPILGASRSVFIDHHHVFTTGQAEVVGRYLIMERRLVGDPLLIHITSPDLSKRYPGIFYTLWNGSDELG